jgi:hypothetical protein
MSYDVKINKYINKKIKKKKEKIKTFPDVVMEFFIDINPSDRIMALGSTESLREMSTKCISFR